MSSDIRRFRCDDETGEVLTYPVSRETGEPQYDAESYVPSASLNDKFTYADPVHTVIRFRKGYSTNAKKFHILQENIIAGSNPISYRLLMIPSMMLFPAAVSVLLMVMEVYLHVRCHRKNKLLKDENMYYRSPFHVVTKTFCGVCRDSESASKVGHMQDKRRNKYDYLRGIAMYN